MIAILPIAYSGLRRAKRNRAAAKRSGVAVERKSARHPESARHHSKRPSLGFVSRGSAIALSLRGSSVRVEYLVRQARITDIDRLSALCAENGVAAALDSPIDATGLLRQLVYIPNASVLIAEVGRQMAGGAILALRPSVEAGGFVGTADVLVVGQGYDTEEVADALIDEALRSARNKGCVTVEVMLAKDAALRACWQRHGFTEAATHVYRVAVADRAPAAR